MNHEERKEMADIHFGMLDIVVDEFLSRERNRQFKPYRDEFMGVACVALVRASEKFDETRGFQFRTYASNYIRAMMTTLKAKLRRDHYKEVYLEDLMGTSAEPRTEDDKDKEYLEEKYGNIVDDLEPKDPFDKQVYRECIIGGKGFRTMAKEMELDKPWRIYKAKKRILKNLRKQLDIKETI